MICLRKCRQRFAANRDGPIVLRVWRAAVRIQHPLEHRVHRAGTLYFAVRSEVLRADLRESASSFDRREIDATEILQRANRKVQLYQHDEPDAPAGAEYAQQRAKRRKTIGPSRFAGKSLPALPQADHP